MIYIFIQWFIYRREDWVSTPGFKEFEAGSLSGPVIGPTFRPGLGMEAR